MKVCFISQQTHKNVKEYLINIGWTLVEVLSTNTVYPAIASHTDIYMCPISDNTGNCCLYVANEATTFPEIEDLRSGVSFPLGSSMEMKLGQLPLGHGYPENVKFNGVQVGRRFVHNSEYTDPVLLKGAEDAGLEVLSVKQGYTKCNLVVVDDNSVITSDRGIASTLQKASVDVLLIRQGHVVLAGFPYGFLGGASGNLGSTILFHGDLSRHPDFMVIKDFIQSKGKEPVWFTAFPLTDIGSILSISLNEL